MAANPDIFADRKALAQRAFLAGRNEEAIAALRAIIAERAKAGTADRDDHMRLGLYCHQAGLYEQSLAALADAAHHFPSDPEIAENRAVCLLSLGRVPEAIRALDLALDLGSRSLNVHDALARAHSLRGDREKSRAHGTLSLEAKHRQSLAAGTRHRLPPEPAPPFDPSRPERNIIAFSLYGTGPRYLEGALANVALAKGFYPGWTCRFSVDDSLPGPVAEALGGMGAEIRRKPRPASVLDGLLWRFEVANDPEVRHFLVRDADSVVNVRECRAVEEWLASGRYFHAMRDGPTQTDLVMAGLWGGVGGVLPPLERLEFRPHRAATRHIDQDFLRWALWPTLSQSILVHDGYFDCLESRPFPLDAILPPGCFLGQNIEGLRRALQTWLRSEDRDQRTEVRDQGSDVRDQP